MDQETTIDDVSEATAPDASVICDVCGKRFRSNAEWLRHRDVVKRLARLGRLLAIKAS